jgi:SOS response regulatory protein OraA/RecX
LVEECIREVYEESDVHLISSIYYRNEAKYNLNNNVSRQKFIASMMSKGFKYGDIKDFLS